MKNTKMKIVIMVFIFIFLLMMNTIIVQATLFDDVIQKADDFVNPSATTVSGDSIKELFVNIFNIFFTIGVIIAVIITSVIGIKFLISSPAGKAEIKETLMPYVTGCIVIFGAYGIWRLVLIILQPLN